MIDIMPGRNFKKVLLSGALSVAVMLNPVFSRQVNGQEASSVQTCFSSAEEQAFFTQAAQGKRFVVLHGRGSGPTGNWIPQLSDCLRQMNVPETAIRTPQLPLSDTNMDCIQAANQVNDILDESGEETELIAHSAGTAVVTRTLSMRYAQNKLSPPIHLDWIAGRFDPDTADNPKLRACVNLTQTDYSQAGNEVVSIQGRAAEDDGSIKIDQSEAVARAFGILESPNFQKFPFGGHLDQPDDYGVVLAMIKNDLGAAMATTLSQQ